MSPGNNLLFLCVACSYFKRLLETTSRFSYIEHAYKNMALWMKNGTEPEKKLKRYIHRHLALPDEIDESIDRDEAQRFLMEFAFRYIDALLIYCSDVHKPGVLSSQVCVRVFSHLDMYIPQVTSSCAQRHPRSSAISPLARSFSTACLRGP